MISNFSLQVLGRIVVVTVLLLLAILLLWRFLPALGWAGVLAIATWPLRERLTRRFASPTAAAIVLTVVVGLLIIGPLIVLVLEAAREGVLVLEWLRSVRQTGLGTPEWLAQLPFIGASAATWWHEHLGSPDAAKDLIGRAETMGLVHWTRHLGHELISRLIILGFTLLSVLFVYRDGPRIIEQARNVADRVLGPPAHRFGAEAIAAVRATVNGLVLVGLAEGAVLGVAYVAAGLSHPLLLAFATGILAAVPFGAPFVYMVACLILFSQSRAIAAAVLFVFATLVIFVADHFVRPALIGMSTRLPFLWILLGIFGGLETFGLLGLFLGPAILAVVLAIWREAAKPAA
jgi:predicted PurR-regulated permease PerM